MKNFIQLSMLLLATPLALALWAGNKGSEINTGRICEVQNDGESLFIGS